MKNFFRLYYAPNNAYLAIVGDFDPAQAKAWVTKYFDRHSARQADHAAGGRAGDADRREAARLRGPRAGAAALRAVADRGREERRRSTRSTCSARILTGSRTARLTKALVYDQQAAAQAFAGQQSNEDVGELPDGHHAAPGHSLTELERRRTRCIERMKAEGPTAEEIQKAKAGRGARRSSAASSRISARPMTLADGAVLLQRSRLLQDRVSRRRWP